MPSDFVDRARVAYAALHVPEPPLAGIRACARHRDRRSRAFIAASVAAVAVASLGLASGAGAAISDAIRVWISGGSAAVDVRGLTLTRYPTRADLAGAAARATFPVIFPVGVRPGMRLQRLITAPSDRPTTLTLEYASANGSTVGITLVDASSVEAGTPAAGTVHTAVERWTAGREEVIASETHAGQVAPIARAMRSSTPAASLAANDVLAARIINLGAPVGAQAAAERAAGDARSVLLDARHLTQMSSLARDGRALLDDRTVTLTDIPRRAGGPDYQHAKLHFSHDVAIPADGVRAIALYLRAHPLAPPASLLFRPDAHGDARFVVMR